MNIKTRILSDLTKFVEAGYKFTFELSPSGIFCAALELLLAPEEFDVNERHQLGDLETDEAHILYLISTLFGVKGTLMLTEKEVYAGNMSFKMAQKLRIDPFGEWICS